MGEHEFSVGDTRDLEFILARPDPSAASPVKKSGQPSRAPSSYPNSRSNTLEAPHVHEFLQELRQAKVPVTLKEYLMLMEALDRDVIDKSVDDFYYLSRAALVKDEKHLDSFDQVFGHVFKGLEKVASASRWTCRPSG